MSKLYAVRSSDLTRTLAVVEHQVARGMVKRGEAEWAPNTRSIILVTKTSQRGLSANPGPKLIERYAMATKPGQDDAAIVAVSAWIGPVNDFGGNR